MAKDKLTQEAIRELRETTLKYKKGPQEREAYGVVPPALQKQLVQDLRLAQHEASKFFKEVQAIREQLLGPFHNLKRATQILLAPYASAFHMAQQISTQLQKQVAPLQQALEPIRQFQQAFAAIPKQQLEVIQKAFSGLTENLREQFEKEERRIFAALAKRGWLGLEVYLTAPDMRRILVIHKEKGKKGVDQFVCRKFRSGRYKLLNRMVRTWQCIPYMKKRRKIVREAIKAHKEGRYALSIPALLPLVDGLSVGLVGRTPKKAI
jgi:hypothetical protein